MLDDVLTSQYTFLQDGFQMYWGCFGIFVFGNVCPNHGLHSDKGSVPEGLASVFCDYAFLVGK